MEAWISLPLLLLSLRGASAVTHSVKYFYTASSGVPNFPEFVVVGLVDEVEMFHYDSNTKRAEPKQDWMNRVTEDDPQYWQRQNETCVGDQQVFKASIKILKQRFNQTGGVHIVQRMVGCEWDNETGEISGYEQYGYNGEDFISLDLKTESWISPNPEAVITKHKWDHNTAQIAYLKNYHTQICPYWLKKYVDYGRSSLLRKDLPSVSLLQKSPSSPVSCHATGFYPNSAMMFWRKDGEELHEDVDHGEILHNHDGSFQMSSDLDVSSVPPEDWRKYDCVFQLSGVKDDIVTKLDKAVIRTNREKPSDMTIPIIAAVVVTALVLIAVIGYVVYKNKKAPLKSPQHDMKTSSDTSPTGTLISQPESETSSSSVSPTESINSNTPLTKDMKTSSDTFSTETLISQPESETSSSSVSPTESINSNTPLTKDMKTSSDTFSTETLISQPESETSSSSVSPTESINSNTPLTKDMKTSSDTFSTETLISQPESEASSSSVSSTESINSNTPLIKDESDSVKRRVKSTP